MFDYASFFKKQLILVVFNTLIIKMYRYNVTTEVSTEVTVVSVQLADLVKVV